MSNFKKNQAVAGLLSLENELEKTVKAAKAKSSILRTLAKRPRTKAYYITEAHYRKKITEISLLCDRINKQLDTIEEEHASAQKFEQIRTETDPGTGFTHSSMRPKEKRS